MCVCAAWHGATTVWLIYYACWKIHIAYEQIACARVSPCLVSPREALTISLNRNLCAQIYMIKRESDSAVSFELGSRLFMIFTRARKNAHAVLLPRRPTQAHTQQPVLCDCGAIFIVGKSISAHTHRPEISALCATRGDARRHTPLPAQAAELIFVGWQTKSASAVRRFRRGRESCAESIGGCESIDICWYFSCCVCVQWVCVRVYCII